jgi:hypothetical protein
MMSSSSALIRWISSSVKPTSLASLGYLVGLRVGSSAHTRHTQREGPSHQSSQTRSPATAKVGQVLTSGAARGARRGAGGGAASGGGRGQGRRVSGADDGGGPRRRLHASRHTCEDPCHHSPTRGGSGEPLTGVGRGVGARVGAGVARTGARVGLMVGRRVFACFLICFSWPPHTSSISSALTSSIASELISSTSWPSSSALISPVSLVSAHHNTANKARRYAYWTQTQPISWDCRIVSRRGRERRGHRLPSALTSLLRPQDKGGRGHRVPSALTSPPVRIVIARTPSQ